MNKIFLITVMFLCSLSTMASSDKDKEFLNGPELLDFCTIGEKKINFRATLLVSNDDRRLQIARYAEVWKKQCERVMSENNKSIYLQKNMVHNIAHLCTNTHHFWDDVYSRNPSKSIDCTRQFFNKQFTPEAFAQCEKTSSKDVCLKLVDKDSVYPPLKQSKYQKLKRDALKLPHHELKELYERLGDKLGVSDTTCQPGVVNGSLRDLKEVSDQAAPATKPASGAAKQ